MHGLCVSVLIGESGHSEETLDLGSWVVHGTCLTSTIRRRLLYIV